MKCSGSETLMMILQDLVRGGAETKEEVTISIILSSAQVPPSVPHWLRTMEYAFFFQPSPGFPIGLFNLCL
jgi:hypothetical protein